jgi:hypothetical protein
MTFTASTRYAGAGGCSQPGPDAMTAALLLAGIYFQKLVMVYPSLLAPERLSI